MKTKGIKKLLLIFLLSLMPPILLLLQKYNRHLSYDPSFTEIFIEYVFGLFGLFVIFGILFLIDCFKVK